MVGRRQRTGLFTGSKLHPQFEGRVSSNTANTLATRGFRASVNQLDLACSDFFGDARHPWYDLFANCSYGEWETVEQFRRYDHAAKLKLMRTSHEEMAGEGGIFQQARTRALEWEWLPKEGDTPTPEQEHFAVALLKFVDKHAAYRTMLDNLPAQQQGAAR